MRLRRTDYLTRRLEYREYLNSPLWKEKRREALQHYGSSCQHCGSQGHCEIHHKRYPRILGEESVHDLQPLCGKCHKMLHKAIDSKRKIKHRKKKVIISAQRAWSMMDPVKREELMRMCDLQCESDLYIRFIDSTSKLPKVHACRMLGIDGIYAFGGKKGKKRVLFTN
jgi:hypothetical protein